MPPLSRTAPLAVFVLLVAGFAYSLTNDPRRLPSTLIDKPVPSFNLADRRTPPSTRKTHAQQSGYRRPS